MRARATTQTALQLCVQRRLTNDFCGFAGQLQRTRDQLQTKDEEIVKIRFALQHLQQRWLCEPGGTLVTPRRQRRSVLETTSQELVLTMAKLEETKCAWKPSTCMRHGACPMITAVSPAGTRNRSKLQSCCRGELGTRTSENQLIKSSYHLLKRCAQRSPDLLKVSTSRAALT